MIDSEQFKKRHGLTNTGMNTMPENNWSQRPETPKRSMRWKEIETNVDNIPAAGYSGHMPGLRHVDIGKPFNIAAREAKRDYAIRRRAQSGDRDNVCSTEEEQRSRPPETIGLSV
ncbi:hypothetical protein KIN20_015843 [Parelaphostrongylus tenuis]|uniref:Uncharacterized protein n=1 Tax=Parelaphostrongylus tenuis TaxID=148309 RepID=A0AAD5QMI4_PARTN|nr:hypothetical protein KIN20_015843 [Parelaphostrongylus tenuis]